MAEVINPSVIKLRFPKRQLGKKDGLGEILDGAFGHGVLHDIARIPGCEGAVFGELLLGEDVVGAGRVLGRSKTLMPR